MKTVNNQKVTYIVKEPDENFTRIIDKSIETDYFQIILESCAAQMEGGFHYDIIKKINRVEVVINKSDGFTAQFEDSDFEFVKERISKRKWRVPDIQFVEFMDYISNIK